ncbi:MAG: FG-GAP-like repeat-containing protein [Chlorobi bacterium]|nr:FG-GAP-like repeat-containing protein [Chlorobiota bacterium]MCI0715767.1 FG-GAP-like repeat-containing protein [Chlorobiota bacterium]
MLYPKMFFFSPILFFVICFFSGRTQSQYFVKVTDPNNPVVSEPLTGSYIGTSWVDVDGDERLDLFICRKDIFKNLGNGNFIKLENSIPLQGTVIGNSWADYDNDGDIDVFIISTVQANPTSHLYRNEGNGMFTKILSGMIGDSVNNTGWGCTWGDINNDSYADLFLAAASGFGGVNHPNRLFYNNGDGTFIRIDSTSITDSIDAFTIPIFSDYDLDGDIDLFIGTGPANNIGGRDYLFRNFLKELNTSYYFQRIDTGIIGTDIVDGQNWNWIDYDNDGDLDAFLTNYSQNILNRLYRCEGLRYYVRMTEAQVGTIVSDPGLYLANTWGDFDNDGDLDCFLTRDAVQQSRYYSNNGNGTFTRIDTMAITTGPGTTYGATIGDYNNDGNLDLFVAGTTNSKGLYRNETQNGNKWVNIRCVGSGPGNSFSNKSALGTIVKAKATISNNAVWQIREINAQNSFNSMNSLNVHFGFGNASIVDSLIIIWPRGLVQIFTNVELNKFYKAVEGQGLTEIIIGILQISSDVPESFFLYQNYPNPFNPVTKIKFSIQERGAVRLVIFDILGKEVSSLIDQPLQQGTYETEFDASNLASGIYFYTLQSANFTLTKKMILIK